MRPKGDKHSFIVLNTVVNETLVVGENGNKLTVNIVIQYSFVNHSTYRNVKNEPVCEDVQVVFPY